MQLAAGQMPSEHLSLLAHFQLAHSADAGASPGLQPRVLESQGPLLCSPALPPPAVARLTGGATSAWHDRNKTCPSHAACNFRNYSQLTGSQEAGVFWGFGALRSAATPPRAVRLALGGPWQGAQDPPGPCRLGSTAPGAAHSPGHTVRPRRPGLRRRPEQAP